MLPEFGFRRRHIAIKFFPGTDQPGGVARAKILGVVRLCISF
jgi:hypothetical protein